MQDTDSQKRDERKKEEESKSSEVIIDPHVVCSDGAIYIILGRLGETKREQVYEAEAHPARIQILAGGDYFVKFFEHSNHLRFEQEFKFMLEFQGRQGFPQVVNKGSSQSHATKNLEIQNGTMFMVFQKLGSTLIEIFQHLNYKMVKIDVLKIGLQLINLIEKMHKLCILHYDINPGNIWFSNNILKQHLSHNYSSINFERYDEIQRFAHHLMKNSQVDYGRPMTINNLNLAYFGSQEYSIENFDPVFTSRWVLQGERYSMRDDVIAIVYSLLYLIDPHDSWFVQSTYLPRDQTIHIKVRASERQLTGGEHQQCLVPLFREAYKYSINETPNYAKLAYLLKKELINVHCLPDNIFSFLQRNVKFNGYVILNYSGENRSDDNDLDENSRVNKTQYH